MTKRLPNHRDRGPPVVLQRPAPGYYRRKFNGRWVPALIEAVPARDPVTLQAMDRPPALRCVIEGQEVDLDRVWPMYPVTEAEYQRLVAEAAEVEPEADRMNRRVRL